MTWKTVEEELPVLGKKVLVFIHETKKYKVCSLFVRESSDLEPIQYWNLPGRNVMHRLDAWCNFEYYKQIYEETYE